MTRARISLPVSVAVALIVGGGLGTGGYWVWRPDTRPEPRPAPSDATPPPKLVDEPKRTTPPPVVGEKSIPEPRPPATSGDPAPVEPKTGQGLTPLDKKQPSSPPPPPVMGRGTLQLNSFPWAEVTVDGQVAGNTPLQLELEAGDHRVQLRERGNPDREETIEIHIEADQTTRHTHRFFKH